ncbi:uncharacterized protein LOC111345827 [Stylophora pistillata]|uniref:uncharacterized protein LOC111345827 n=1 Tax=Stylophora pistillata TaxID=50429 RepID=UPI000C0390DD|nr:uncharacterized protein LOC111345827 [Stylophora pistillata]
MTTRMDIDERAPLRHYSSFCLLNSDEDRRRKRSIKPWAVGFGLLLLWDVGGTCLFTIRSVTCITENSTFYFCEKNAAFPFSEELAITWLATHSIFLIIVIFALQKVPEFLGYKTILNQLKFLPSYWTLMILLLISLTRYAKLAIFSKSIDSWIILMALAFNYFLRTTFAGFLNYTQLNFLKRQYPSYIFVLSKLTVLVLFGISLLNLLATILELTVEVHKVHRTIDAKRSVHFEMINDLLREFGTTTFRFKLTSFFWQKLFTDDKNILSNQAPLR